MDGDNVLELGYDFISLMLLASQVESRFGQGEFTFARLRHTNGGLIFQRAFQALPDLHDLL
jgi:hypothetical protein